MNFTDIERVVKLRECCTGISLETIANTLQICGMGKITGDLRSEYNKKSVAEAK
jgi:hypothetical protein